jgi:hypothetical protein
VEHVPAIAVLNAGDQTIRIPFPDVLAASEDFDNSPMIPGIIANGVIKLDPDTITPEVLELLEVAFRRQELIMGEDQTVHLLHICIQLKLEQLFVCMDEQPEVYVTDNNFLALTACLLDHDRSRGNLLQFCLHRLHNVGPKFVAHCPRNPRYFLENRAIAPLSDALADARSLSADPNSGGCSNARDPYTPLSQHGRVSSQPRHLE